MSHAAAIMTFEETDAVCTRIQAGAVALLPTDTVYGLAASPRHADAIARLFALKQRPAARNLPVMIGHADALTAMGVMVSLHARRLLASPLMPGAVSIVLGFADGATRPSWLEDRDEVAVRIPDSPPLCALLCKTGPLLVTSANRHNEPTMPDAMTAAKQLAHMPDIIIDGGALATVPSTIVNCRTDEPAIERVGSIPERTIMDSIYGENPR